MASQFTQARGRAGDKLIYSEKKVAYTTTFNKRNVATADKIEHSLPIDLISNSSPTQIKIPIPPSRQMLGNTYEQDLKMDAGYGGASSYSPKPETFEQSFYHKIEIDSIVNNQPVLQTDAELMDNFLKQIHGETDPHAYITLLFETFQSQITLTDPSTSAYSHFEDEQFYPICELKEMIVAPFYVPKYLTARDYWNITSMDGYCPTIDDRTVCPKSTVIKLGSSHKRVNNFYYIPDHSTHTFREVNTLDLWKDLQCVSTVIQKDEFYKNDPSQRLWLKLVAIDLMNKISHRFLNDTKIFDFLKQRCFGWVVFSNSSDRQYALQLQSDFNKENVFNPQEHKERLYCPLFKLVDIVSFLYDDYSILENTTLEYPLAGLFLAAINGVSPNILTPTESPNIKSTTSLKDPISKTSLHKHVAKERVHLTPSRFSITDTDTHRGEVICLPTPFMAVNVNTPLSTDVNEHLATGLLRLRPYSDPNFFFFNTTPIDSRFTNFVRDPLADWFEAAEILSQKKSFTRRDAYNPNINYPWNYTELIYKKNLPWHTANINNVNLFQNKTIIEDTVCGLTLEKPITHNNTTTVVLLQDWLLEYDTFLSYALTSDNTFFFMLVFKEVHQGYSPYIAEVDSSFKNLDFFEKVEAIGEVLNFLTGGLFYSAEGNLITQTEKLKNIRSINMYLTQSRLDYFDVDFSVAYVNTNFRSYFNQMKVGFKRTLFMRQFPLATETQICLNLYPFWRRLIKINVSNYDLNSITSLQYRYSIRNSQLRRSYPVTPLQKIFIQITQKIMPHLSTICTQSSNSWGKKNKLYIDDHLEDPLNRGSISQPMSLESVINTAIQSRGGNLTAENDVIISTPLFFPMIAQLTDCNSLQVNRMLNFAMGFFQPKQEQDGSTRFVPLGDTGTDNLLRYSDKERILLLELTNTTGRDYLLQVGSQSTVVYTIKTYLRTHNPVYKDD